MTATRRQASHDSQSVRTSQRRRLRRTFTPEQLAELKSSIGKRDELASYLRWTEIQAGRLREQEHRLAERRRKLEESTGTVKEELHQLMLGWGLKRIKGNAYSFVVRRNPPKCQIDDVATLPGEYVQHVPKIRLQAIVVDLKAGKEVPGAKLTCGTRLIIR